MRKVFIGLFLAVFNAFNFKFYFYYDEENDRLIIDDYPDKKRKGH